jgi:hypothetical protein
MMKVTGLFDQIQDFSISPDVQVKVTGLFDQIQDFSISPDVHAALGSQHPQQLSARQLYHLGVPAQKIGGPGFLNMLDLILVHMNVAVQKTPCCESEKSFPRHSYQKASNAPTHTAQYSSGNGKRRSK